MKQTKITVKLHSKLLEAFNLDVDRLFLKRDAFLNKLISVETSYLSSEFGEQQLSAKAKRFIAGELKRLGTTPVNIVVDQVVADELNAVVARTNIVRDAFFNRLIWMLRGSDSLLAYLDLPRFINGSEFDRFVPEAMPTAPMRAIYSVQCDPLHYLRVGCEERHSVGLHLLDLPRELWGYSCWLDDTAVPGTPSYIDTEKMLTELGFIESEAFKNFVLKPKKKEDRS